MLSRLSTVVQSAVNALAPPAPLLDDFEYHWKRLMNHYLVVSPQNRASIELTNIPFHLDSLFEILLNEKMSNLSRGETGVCLEYLLQNDLMNLLATLGTGDDPPGMKQYVLRFTSKIITQFYNPLLAHAAIHQPIKRLIQSCDGNLHSASESDELHFLFLLSSLLRVEIPFASIFLSHLNDDSSTPESNSTKKEPCRPRNLLDALLTYINSADTNIRIKTCQAIMLLTSLRESQVSDFIVTETNLTVAITTRLVNLFDEIQDNSDIDCIQEINVSWGLDVLMSDTTATYHGYPQLILFFSWFDFINQLIGEGETAVSTALCEVVKICFVECVFSQDFLSHCLSLAVLTKCIAMATTTSLFSVLREWLLGNNSLAVDLPNNVLCPQMKLLLENCFETNEIVCLHTLKLFSALIEKYDDVTLNILVINAVCLRQYYDVTSSSDDINSWSDIEDEREKKSSAGTESRTLAPSNSDKIVESYQSLFPSSLKSSATYSDHEIYLKDVEVVYKQVKDACTKFTWPSEAVTDDAKTNAQPFYEGPFLNMLFKKVENLPGQTYLINLELSSIISRLCLLPNPYLHEFLLNPYFPRKPGTPSLCHLLQTVATSLTKQLLVVNGYRERLAFTRRYLMGNEQEIRDGQNNLFESVIVLEEMCKELAAVVYVKCHCAS